MRGVPHKNVTLSLPEPLLKKFKVFAATREQSMSGLMTAAIEKMMNGGTDDRDKAAERFLKRIKNAPDRKVGPITWNREELYDRGIR